MAILLQIKKLRQFHGPNVSLVTKSIMDVLFTNRLGCKMSLTGRGALNKKDKEPLKTTLLFKIISGELFIIFVHIICQLYSINVSVFNLRCYFKIRQRGKCNIN